MIIFFRTGGQNNALPSPPALPHHMATREALDALFAGSAPVEEGEIQQQLGPRILLRDATGRITAFYFGNNNTIRLGLAPENDIRLSAEAAAEYVGLNSGETGKFVLHRLPGVPTPSEPYSYPPNRWQIHSA